MLSDLGRDLRYALRSLLRTPTLTATVIATLSLGIGANAVIFSAVDAVLLRDAPVSDPDSLVDVYHDIRQQPLLELVLSGLLRPARQWHVRVAGGLHAGVHHDGRERARRNRSPGSS